MPLVVLAHTQDRKNIQGRNLTQDKTLTKYVAFEREIGELSEEGRIVIIEVPEKIRDYEFEFLTANNIAGIEPTSANAFAAMRLYAEQNHLDRGINAVILNTGKGEIFSYTPYNKL